ncbi:MAG: biopolymer transporter ExbD [Polyangiaceae bacterium]
MTPLIDVMLVLLVIFMVTAPLRRPACRSIFPRAKSAPMQADDTKLLVIVTRDEQVFLGKDDITGAVGELGKNPRAQGEGALHPGRRKRSTASASSASWRRRARPVQKLGADHGSLIVK